MQTLNGDPMHCAQTWTTASYQLQVSLLVPVKIGHSVGPESVTSEGEHKYYLKRAGEREKHIHVYRSNVQYFEP